MYEWYTKFLRLACVSTHQVQVSLRNQYMSHHNTVLTYWTIMLMSASLNPVAMSIPTIIDATGTSADSQSLCLYAWSSLLSASRALGTG